MTTFENTMRERSMRRLEQAARNRDESARIRALKDAEREAARADQMALKYFEGREITESLECREERWNKRLQTSPLAIDLTAESDKRARSRMRSQEANKRSQSLESSLKHSIETTVLSQGLMDNPIEMAELRREKRELLLQFKQLKAIRDVERTNSRIFQISSMKSVNM